jgi:hypothetical protein
MHLTANPLWILLHSWRPAPLRYLLRDTIVNVTLYIPLGFAAHLVFRQSRFPGFGIYGPVLLGLLFIVERQPLPSLLLGAVAGVVLFAVWHRDTAPTKVQAGLFLAVVAVRGLSPFQFATGSTEFSWVPFGATLSGDWQSAFRVLIEKVFYYGTAIWLLRAAGVRLVRSVILVAAVLAFIEVVQIHLPGRTPEITDPILAILVGFALAMLLRPARGLQVYTRG